MLLKRVFSEVHAQKTSPCAEKCRHQNRTYLRSGAGGLVGAPPEGSRPPPRAARAREAREAAFLEAAERSYSLPEGLLHPQIVQNDSLKRFHNHPLLESAQIMNTFDV